MTPEQHSYGPAGAEYRCPECLRLIPAFTEHSAPTIHPQPLIDDGFLDERIPRHEATVERRDWRRSGCSIFVLAVVVLWRLV